MRDVQDMLDIHVEASRRFEIVHINVKELMS